MKKRTLIRLSGSPSPKLKNPQDAIRKEDEKEEEKSITPDLLRRTAIRSQTSISPKGKISSSAPPPLPLFSLNLSSLLFHCKFVCTQKQSSSLILSPSSSSSSTSPKPSHLSRGKSLVKGDGESEWELLASFSFYNSGDDPIEVTFPRSLLHHLVLLLFLVFNFIL